MKRLSIFAALAIAASPAPALAAEPTEVSAAPPMVIIQPVEPPAFGWRMPAMPFDNMRLGVAQLHNHAISRLFGGNGGLSVGLDVPLGQGLAVAIDTMNLRKDYTAGQYWLSVNPVQLRYRMGLSADTAASVQPFVTLGAGLTAMGLFGQSDLPRLGVGPAFSSGVGATLWDTVALEAGVQGGQAAQIPYWGWMLRAGTGFGSLDRLTRWLPAQVAAAPQPPVASRPSVPARSLTGRVVEVTGDRLTIAYPQAPTEGVGDDLLIFYQDGIVVKVARARVVELLPDGRAVAQVVANTEPVRPGYQVRAW
jgi:hypothetical protein